MTSQPTNVGTIFQNFAQRASALWQAYPQTRLLVIAWVVIAFGVLLAHFVQTAGGVTIKDVRFTGAGGKTTSALLYIPKNATPETKAPGILAVHGYINSREVQSGFAIEFARRGYVVLTPDQSGHGYSDGPAFADGFGGPAALAYLSNLDIVDRHNIGLEGHSMGGWAVLAAAAAYPDGYRSMVLEGSSTGAPFAAEGTAEWPRNLALVFSAYDEFAQTMWGADRAPQIKSTNKLKTLFGSEDDVVEGRVYGEVSSGSARILFQPPVTHAGDHLSRGAIGHSLDWFAKTVEGGTPLAADNQIWPFKELGTFVALVGVVMLVLGTFHLLIRNPYFALLTATPGSHAFERRSPKWWGLVLLSAALPVATFYLFFGWGEWLLPPSFLLPQAVTNQVIFWAVLNGLLGALIGWVWGGGTARPSEKVLPSVLLAVATIGIAYMAVLVASFFFTLDFRIWFVGLKPLSSTQFVTALIYLVPLTFYFVLAMRALLPGLSVKGDTRWAQYGTNAAVMAGGFILFLSMQYGSLFSTGLLLTPSEPLNTIIMIQFVPLMLIVSVIATYTYRRTARILPGALINALFVAWYVTAGQATQYGAP